MREYVYGLLSEDEDLAVIMGIAIDDTLHAHIYAANALDSAPSQPFIVLRWETDTDKIGPLLRRDLTVWVYDAVGDYRRIDNIHKQVRTLLESVSAQATTSGWITVIEWQGAGGDLYDDVYQSITRNATYRCVGSGI